MPLYEYLCEHCDHRFEQIQRFSDPPVDNCPLCDGSVRKLVSSPAIQFKGTGWYVTDYARQGKKDSSGESESQDGKSDKKGANAPDSKDSSKANAAPATASKTPKRADS